MHQQNASIYNSLPRIQTSTFMQQLNAPFSMPSDQEETQRLPKRSKKLKLKHSNHHTGVKCTNTAERGVQKPKHCLPATGNTARVIEVLSMAEGVKHENEVLGLEKERPHFERAVNVFGIDDKIDPIAEAEDEEIAHVCDWCFCLKPLSVAYKNIENIGEQRTQYFCSQKCFDSFRKVAYKKTKVCCWCGEGGYGNEPFPIGEELIHFCSEMHHKLELLRRDGLLQVFACPLDENGTITSNSHHQNDTPSSLMNAKSGHRKGRRILSLPERGKEIPEKLGKFNTYWQQQQRLNKEKNDNSNGHFSSAHSKTQEKDKTSVNDIQSHHEAEIFKRVTQRSFVKVKPDHMLKESFEVKRSICTKSNKSINGQKTKEPNSQKNKVQNASSIKPDTTNPAIQIGMSLQSRPHPGPKFRIPRLPPHLKLSEGHPPIGLPMHGLQKIPPHILMSLGLGLAFPPGHHPQGTNYVPHFSQTTVTHTIPFFVPLPIPVPVPIPIKCKQEACIKEETKKKRIEEEEWKRYIQMAADEDKVEKENRGNEEKMQEEYVSMKNRMEEEEVKNMDLKQNTREVDKQRNKSKIISKEATDIEDNILVIDEEISTKKSKLPKEQTSIKIKIYNRKTVVNTNTQKDKPDNNTIYPVNKDNISRIHRRAKIFDRSTEKFCYQNV